MHHSQQLLLDVWREACRHIEINEFTATVADTLLRHLPIKQVIVRRFELGQSDFVTLAAAPLIRSARLAEDRCHLGKRDSRRFLDWAAAGKCTHSGTSEADLLRLIWPLGASNNLLAAPLSQHGEATGVLMLIAAPAHVFTQAELELVESLTDPFSVALDNDRRIHEIASLREAAEADRGSLLRRLGRKEIVEEIVGEQTGLKFVMERVSLVAESDVPVMILGETGTGKEVVARAIHNRSNRHSGPFIRVNCGAIPRELIDSQLFGHERGSFTGANQTRQGWFERADNGTLLLDEIGELPLEAQVRFLRVLQDGFIERVGGTQPLHVNVRIIAATHRDLAQMIREGKFREDLWYRLAVFPILMPPLRERKEDIPALARHFVERASLRFGLPVTYPNDADVELLQQYNWPGNIREFGAVIDRAVILGNGEMLDVTKSLGSNSHHSTQNSPSAFSLPATPSSTRESDSLMTLDEAMKAHIEQALSYTRGMIEGHQGAARILGINPHTLRARMRKLGIDWSVYRK